MSRPNAQLVFAIMKVSLALFLFMFVINRCASFRVDDSCGIDSYLLNGNCTECPDGLIGPNCTGLCPAGYYGEGCIQACKCRDDQKCDAIQGCTRANGTECPEGIYGPDCLYDCPAGHYGKGCTQECDCKTDQMCDPRRGCVGTNGTGNSTIIPHGHSGHAMIRYWLFLVLAFGGGASLVSILYSLCYCRCRFCGRREEQNQEGGEAFGLLASGLMTLVCIYSTFLKTRKQKSFIAAIVRPEIELDCVHIENVEYDDVGEPEPIYVVIDENV